jgi:two-component system, sensor histidine kinase and response regulator
MTGAVLLVEDEAELRDSLREVLEDEGYQVDAAANGLEAMAMLALRRPCIVILDLIMPLMSGNEVYEAMQADPQLSQIPVVVSTSDSSRAPAGVLLMKKPVNLDRLLDTVAKFCRPF